MSYSTKSPKRFFEEHTGFRGSTPPIQAMNALLPSGPVLWPFPFSPAWLCGDAKLEDKTLISNGTQ